MSRIRILPICLAVILPLSCRTGGKKPGVDAEIAGSDRGSVITDAMLDGLNFNFCPTKRSMSLVNNLWLTYFSILSYSHFKVIGPRLESLGFGDAGEGKDFLRKWYVLRLKRVNEKIIDTDDKWNSEAERELIYKKLLAEYQGKFGINYKDDGQKAVDFQQDLVNGQDTNKKIIFLSSLKKRNDGNLDQKSSQAFYAENSKLDFSVIVFRGTEVDQVPDIQSDALIAHKEMKGMGMVHTGFSDGYEQISEGLLKILEERSKFRPLRLWISGHSLGAALATVMTADLMLRKERGEFKNVELVGNYNMGSPRIGDSVFAQNFDNYAEKQKISVVRFRNHADLVTGLPTGAPNTNGYWHVGALGYYDASEKLFYGDGWENIETNSDIFNSFPNQAGDHRLVAYFGVAKKAFMAGATDDAGTCDVKPNDRPLRGYKENPKQRAGS